jgi:DNA-binding NarL/FixJ family response regulator
MSMPLLDRFAIGPVDGTARQPRIGIAFDGEVVPRELMEVLAASGLSVNAGIVHLAEVGQLEADPPAVVIAVVESEPTSRLAALRSLRKVAPDTHVVVVTQGKPVSTTGRMSLNAGADAFVPGAHVKRALVPAVHAVLAGLVCAPRDMRQLVVKPAFSHREKQVLGLMLEGLTNRQIADRLFLAESTVKSHLASAFAKLGVRSRKDAAAVLLDPAEGLAASALPVPATAALGVLGGRRAGDRLPTSV